MELAALKIQAVQRGKMARKEVERLMAAGADDDSVRRAEEQELAMRFFQVTPKEQKAAAVKVQSAYRGKLARRQVMKVLDQKMVKDDDASGGNMSKKDLAELETEVALTEIFSRIASDALRRQRRGSARRRHRSDCVHRSPRRVRTRGRRASGR